MPRGVGPGARHLRHEMKRRATASLATKSLHVSQPVRLLSIALPSSCPFRRCRPPIQLSRSKIAGDDHLAMTALPVRCVGCHGVRVATSGKGGVRILVPCLTTPGAARRVRTGGVGRARGLTFVAAGCRVLPYHTRFRSAKPTNVTPTHDEHPRVATRRTNHDAT